MSKLNKQLIRPSFLPLIARCQASLLDRGFHEHTTSLPAELGTCAHDLFDKEVIEGNKLTHEVIAKYAEKHNVPVDGFQGLNRKVIRMESAWTNEAKHLFPQPIRETKIGYNLTGEIRLEGTPDVAQLNIEHSFGVVLDLKTGDSDLLDMMVQVKGYCLIFMREHSHYDLQRMFGILFNPVLEHYETVEFSKAELEEFELEIAEWINTAGDKYNAGAHCAWCPRIMACPRNLEVVQGIITDETLPEITLDNIAKARPIIKMMAKFVKEYDLLETALMEANDSQLDLGENLLVYNKTKKRTWDSKKAIADLRIMRPKMTEADIFGVLEFKKTKAELFIKDTAGKGMKGKDAKAFTELAEKSGSCVVTDQFKKAIIKKEKAIDQEKK
jgi:hypothetical protein